MRVPPHQSFRCYRSIYLRCQEDHGDLLDQPSAFSDFTGNRLPIISLFSHVDVSGTYLLRSIASQDSPFPVAASGVEELFGSYQIELCP